MNASLENKIAVVTGGTSGIGKAAALALAKAGAKVVVAGRRENEGQAVVQVIEKSGGKALFVKTAHSDEFGHPIRNSRTLIRDSRTVVGA